MTNRSVSENQYQVVHIYARKKKSLTLVTCTQVFENVNPTCTHLLFRQGNPSMITSLPATQRLQEFLITRGVLPHPLCCQHKGRENCHHSVWCKLFLQQTTQDLPSKPNIFPWICICMYGLHGACHFCHLPYTCSIQSTHEYANSIVVCFLSVRGEVYTVCQTEWCYSAMQFIALSIISMKNN